MKKTITFVLTLVAAMFATQVFATDFKGGTEQYPQNGYATQNVTFSLSEVAEALTTDTATLFAALVDRTAVLSLEYGEGESSTEYSTNTVGFWMKADGSRTTWSSGEAAWYADLFYSEADDQIGFQVGQYPGVLHGGDSQVAHFVLTYGESKLDFYITLNVVATPVVSTRVLADLQTVKTIEVNVTQDARTSTAADDLEVDVADAASLLGYSEEELSTLFGFIIHAESYDKETDSKADTVALAADYTAPAFQLVSLIDDTTGDESPQCVNGTDVAYTKFYVNKMSYAEGKLKFSLYQQAGALKSGDHYYANFYLLKEGKAYVIKVNLNITDHVIVAPSTMTKVGEQVFKYEYSTDNNSAENYAASMAKQRYTIDMATILAAFPEGTTAADLIYMATADPETGELTDALTSSDGFYMDWAGTVCAWQDASMKCKVGYSSSSQYVNFAYTESAPESGSHLDASVYLVYQNKLYYEFKMDITLVSTPAEPEYVEVKNPQDYLDEGKTIYTYDEAADEYTAATSVADGVTYYVLKDDYVEPAPEYTFETCETVTEVEIDIDLVLCASTRTLSRYKIEDGQQVDDKRNVVTDLDADFLIEKIGTSSPEYYVAVKGTAADGSDSIYYKVADADFSSQSLSGNNGGAWLSKDSYNGAWGAEAPIGFSHLNSQIEWWKHDPDDFTELEENTIHFYVANIKTGKKIKYIFNITWVANLSNVETVGKEEVVLACRGNGDESSILEFDLTGVAEALGASIEELENAATWYGLNQNNRPTAALDNSYFYDELDGFKLNADGKLVAEDESDLVYFVNYNFEESAFTAYVVDDINITGTYTTTLYVEYDGKRYEFDVVVTPDPDTYVPDAIRALATGTASAPAIYNLAGQRLSALQKGINIVGGRKVLVK